MDWRVNLFVCYDSRSLSGTALMHEGQPVHVTFLRHEADVPRRAVTLSGSPVC